MSDALALAIARARQENKEERVRAHPFVSADDFYDEGKYGELLEKAAEEVLGDPSDLLKP